MIKSNKTHINVLSFSFKNFYVATHNVNKKICKMLKQKFYYNITSHNFYTNSFICKQNFL